MPVIVVDPTQPDSFPAAAFEFVAGPVSFTAEVPAVTRTAVARCGGTVAQGAEALVTTDPTLPEPAARISAGHAVIKPMQMHSPSAVTQAIELMRRARRRGEWEARMTHQSLLPYLAEEAAEFAEAAQQLMPGEPDSEEHLRKELSDVLLQVLFHAQIAAERGAFDFESVALAFVEKMASRAPYLFDDSERVIPIAEQEKLWAAGKAAELRAAAERRESETS